MLFLFFLASLPQIECPEWLPGTNQVLPPGVTLTIDQKLKNNLRCYCEVVKPAETKCLKTRAPEICHRRTENWIENNITNVVLRGQATARKWRLITVEP